MSRASAHVSQLEASLPATAETAQHPLDALPCVGRSLDDVGRLPASRFDEADSNLLFWGEGQGILKLYNRLHLALALELSGHEEAAQQVLHSVEKINPSFAAGYPEIRELFHCH